MRPNSKTFNQNYSFSSQRHQSYRSYQPKSKMSNLDKWDHSGFDQLQSEQDQFSKLNKLQKEEVNLTTKGDSNQADSILQNETVPKLEEMQADVDSDVASSKQDKSKEFADEISQKNDTKPARKERRPDRQLYSVRQKCTNNARNEEMKRMKEMTIQCSERLNCSAIEKREDYSPYPQAVKDVLIAFEDKDHYPHEDDKLSISNVSTAMSDPLKNWEEESYTKSEITREKIDTTNDISQHVPSSEIGGVLFDLVLETENGTINVRIYQGEEDYEAWLDNLCDAHNFDVKTRLYFKINLIELIIEASLTTNTEETEKLETLLDKLLDINYKLLMYESGFAEADESITPYIVDLKKDELSSTILESFVQCA